MCRGQSEDVEMVGYDFWEMPGNLVFFLPAGWIRADTGGIWIGFVILGGSLTGASAFFGPRHVKSDVRGGHPLRLCKNSCGLVAMSMSKL